MTNEEQKAMLDAMKTDKEGGKRKFWSVDSKFEGTKTIRILPPLSKKGETRFYFPHKVNWIDRVPYEALDQTVFNPDGTVLHEACDDPVQNYVKKLYRNSERGSDEWKLAGELNARPRYISRIIVRSPDDRKSETQPVFYEYGPTIYNMLYHIMTETDFGIIVDPKNGRDYNLTKLGTGRQSKYDTSTPSANVSPVFNDKEMLREMFENAMNMDYTNLIQFVSPEEKKDALFSSLGISTKKQTVVEKPAPKPAPPVDDEVEEEFNYEPDNETVEDSDDGDSDIDDILNEFTN